MRTKAALSIACALALTACGQNTGAPQSASNPPAAPTAVPPVPAPPPGPHRRPGLWEMRVSMDGVDAVQRTLICLDKDSDSRIALWGPQANAACTRSDVVRRPDGSWRFESSCWMGSGGQLHTSGVVMGDLSNRYVVRGETSRSGAETPQMNRTAQMLVDVQRIGACPAGWAAGDTTTGPMRSNALKVSAVR